MAYRSYFKAYASSKQADVMADTSTWMQAMGWVLEDTVSATNHVLSSLGEAGDQNKGWLQLSVSGNNVYFTAWTWWNTATHTGYGQACDFSGQNFFAANAAGNYYLYGSKDLVMYSYNAGSPYAWGHWPKRVVTKPYATLSGAVSAGSSVVIALDNTERFYLNDYYTICDFSTGTREKVQVTTVSAGVSVTVATLANNYSAGSILAQVPTTFGMSCYPSDKNWFFVADYTCSGTVEGPASRYRNLLLATAGAPDPTNNLYTVIPVGIVPQGGSLLCYSDAHIMSAPDSTVNNLYGSVDGDNQYIIGTASAGGATNLDVSGTPFTEDALIGKILVLTGGTGAGQTRYITDNTTSRIVVGQAWATNPNATTTFAIVDRVYRNVGRTFYSGYSCCEERIGEP